MDGDVLVYEVSLALRRDNRLRRCQYEVRCSGKSNALTHGGGDNVRDALAFASQMQAAIVVPIMATIFQTDPTAVARVSGVV